MRYMNREEILSLVTQSDETLREVGIRAAVEGLPTTLSTCLDIIEKLAECDSARLVVTLRSLMPFLKGGYASAMAMTEGEFRKFDEQYRHYRTLVDLLPQRSDALLGRLYKLFEGIRPEIEHLRPGDYSGCLREEEQSRGGHQLMVFVTGVCNLRCSYCFSSDIEHKHISASDLHRIFEWAHRNGCDVVTPCGGEPLIYPNIDLFMDLVEQYDMTTYFASNCTLPLSRFSERHLSRIKLITFHLTESLWHRRDYFDTFCSNIDYARSHGIDIIVRLNIYKVGMDFSPFFDLIEKYSLKKLNIALTIPSGMHDNVFVDPSVFSNHICDIRKVLNFCRARRISLSFAKPIPPCIFDESEAADLLQYDNFKPMCNVCDDNGMRNVCLSPDMVFTPCLGVPTPEVAFADELSWQTLEDALGGKICSALRKPLMQSCRECFLYSRNMCQGACLSYKE